MVASPGGDVHTHFGGAEPAVPRSPHNRAEMLVWGSDLVHHEPSSERWEPDMVAMGTAGIVVVAIVLVVLVVLFIGILRRGLRSQR